MQACSRAARTPRSTPPPSLPLPLALARAAWVRRTLMRSSPVTSTAPSQSTLSLRSSRWVGQRACVSGWGGWVGWMEWGAAGVAAPPALPERARTRPPPPLRAAPACAASAGPTVAVQRAQGLCSARPRGVCVCVRVRACVRVRVCVCCAGCVFCSCARLQVGQRAGSAPHAAAEGVRPPSHPSHTSPRPLPPSRPLPYPPPQVGYCQGMAFVVGLLLFYVPEEPAFQVCIARCANSGVLMVGAAAVLRARGACLFRCV